MLTERLEISYTYGVPGKRRTTARKSLARAKRAPRISRKERQRRQRISESLKRYWRTVRETREERRAEAIETRVPPPSPPGPSLLDWITQKVTEVTRQVAGVTWEPDAGTQNAAFALRDQEPDLAQRFGRHETVTITLALSKFGKLRGAPAEGTRTVIFNTGADAEEFWKNYHAAVRAALDDAIAEARSGADVDKYDYPGYEDYDDWYENEYDDRDAGEVGYESFGVFVAGLA